MDQTSQPTILEDELDAIRVIAVTTVLSPVSRQGVATGEWEDNPTAGEPQPVAWKCLNHDVSFNLWTDVEAHLYENRTPIKTNSESQGVADNEEAA